MRGVTRNMPPSSRQLKVHGAAKINLFLDILRLREDGYHEIETFLQPVGLWDELSIGFIDSGIELTGDDPAIPWDRENHLATLFLGEYA